MSVSQFERLNPLDSKEESQGSTQGHRTTKKQSTEEERVPILCMDVRISSNKTGQMLVYENDDIETLIRKFGAEHKLSESKQAKLKEVLIAQLKTQVMTAIKEEDDSNPSSKMISPQNFTRKQIMD